MLPGGNSSLMTIIPMTRIKRSKNRWTLVAGFGLASALLAVAAPVAPASTTAQNAEVQALLSRMSTLRISSERFTAGITVRPRHLPKGFEGLRKITLQVAGEQSLATPPSAVLTTSAFGTSFSSRIVGDTIYVDDPAVAKHDGGRPWVKETTKGSSGPAGTGLGIGQAGASAPFAGLASLVATGRDVKDLGPATFDGQAVTRISFTIAPAKLATGKLTAPLRGKLGNHASSRLEVDLNAEGLPVRTAGLISIGKVRVGLTADIKAVNFPLTVSAPAPAETITAHELLALIKKSVHKK
jgi:hypothetical protein